MKLKMKIALCLFSFAGVLAGATAQADDLGPIARNADGSVMLMSHREAGSYCATRGGLPTIKQLALVMNPNGVSDTLRDTYSKVAPQSEPQFYYGEASYNRPPGDEGLFFFWSKSYYQGTLSSVFVFNGTNGSIAVTSRGSSHAVRCAGW